MAETRFAEFASTWRDKYPAMIAMWERSWPEFVPFLDFPLPVRKLICTTNGIESLNSRFRQAVRRRGHFPTEQPAMKILYLTVREGGPTARTHRQDQRPEEHPEYLAITDGDRLTIN